MVKSQHIFNIIRNHGEWISSNGAKGERLDLSGADLRCAKLSGCNLDGADLSNTSVKHADLHGSNISGSDLSRVVANRSTKVGWSDLEVKKRLSRGREDKTSGRNQ